MLGLARLPRWFVAVLLVALAAAIPAVAPAAVDDDPPGRVGRLAQVDGEVLWYDSENGAWEAAERNRPLTSGDRLSTAPGARAELRVGSTVLRLAAASELEVRRLDDQRMVFELHSGSLALRVRTRELAREIELVTEEARLAPLRAGHYRLDRIDDSTQAGSWRGELRVLGAGGFDINTGEHVELWREGSAAAVGSADQRRLASTSTPLPQDDFAAWALRADQQDTRSASARHVSPEMTGVEELDRYGRWDRHPEYGAIWFPLVVASDWAPYRHGRWLMTSRWGWTWVDAAPWGFAPSHYGRWLHHGGRWAWAPGAYIHRPHFAPALVAWVGGPNLGVSVNIGGSVRPGYPPYVGWVPLAPREHYQPWYHASPGHRDRIDRPHPVRPRPGEAGRPTIPERIHRQPYQTQHENPQHWANQRAPGGVTVVPRDALFRRDPVQRVVVDGRDRAERTWSTREALPAQAPPERMGPQRPPALTVRTPAPWQQGAAEQSPSYEPRREQVEPEDRAQRPSVAPALAASPRWSEGVQRNERDERGERDERVERFERGDRMQRGEGREADQGPVPVRPVRPVGPDQVQGPQRPVTSQQATVPAMAPMAPIAPMAPMSPAARPSLPAERPAFQRPSLPPPAAAAQQSPARAVMPAAAPQAVRPAVAPEPVRAAPPPRPGPQPEAPQRERNGAERQHSQE